MTIRLSLLAPAAGPALREVRFDDSGLDEAGHRQAHAAAPKMPGAARYFSAPSRRCRETAEALGLAPVVDAALHDWDMGRWRGHSLTEIAATDPDGLAAWTGDPAAAPHGGESLLQMYDRIAAWLEQLSDDSGRTLAVAEPAVIRVAVLHALTAPVQVFWRIDVPPLAVIRLTKHAGRWNLRLG